MLVERGLITPDEGRAILDGDPVLGALPGPAPESGMEVDDYVAALAELGVSANGQSLIEDGQGTG